MVPQGPCSCGTLGAGAAGGSLTQGSGVSWPPKLLPQGSNENLFLTVVSKATCEVWVVVALTPLPAPELPSRASVTVFREACGMVEVDLCGAFPNELRKESLSLNCHLFSPS